MRMAECHPEYRYHAKGLCRKCYMASMNKVKLKMYQHAKSIAQRPNPEYVYSKQPITDIPDMLKDSYWIDQDRKLPKLITC